MGCGGYSNNTARLVSLMKRQMDAKCLTYLNDSNQPMHEKLSDREFEIMIKIAGGKPLKEIGNELCISGKTVSTYRSRIIEKMKLESNTDLAR